MFVFRLWKRVHKPFLFFGLCCFCTIVVGFTSCASANPDTVPITNKLGVIVEKQLSPVNNDALSSEHVSVGQTMTPQKIQVTDRETEVLLGDITKQSSSGNERDFNTVPQLPFCSTISQVIKTKTEENGGTGDEKDSDAADRNSSLDELVPVVENSSPIRSGRHVLVTTLDGQVSLLDQSGKILWSVGTGHLFTSTISALQLSENGKWINLIPSLTGGLYKYDGDTLQPMPLNADSLLRKSFKLSNDVVITGGKEIRTFGVDVSSGVIRYDCGLHDCQYPAKAEFDSDEGQRIVLVIKKQLQTVRAIDSATGAERWNFSVGTHELALSGVTEGCYEGEHKEKDSNFNSDFLKVIIPEGLILGADAENHVVWQQKFESPISQAWVLDNGRLISVDTLRSSPRLDDFPSLYVGIHQQQFYVQEGHTTAEKVGHIFSLDSSSSVHKKNMGQKPLKLEWRPSKSGVSVSENTALTSFTPSPTFQPFFVFDRDEVTTPLPPLEESSTNLPDSVSTDSESDNESNHDFALPDFDRDDGPIQIIFVSLWYWWKEVLGISLLTAVILNILLMRPMVRAVRSETVREMLAVFRYFTNRQKEDEKALVPRRASDNLETPPDTGTFSRHQRTVSTSSTNSQFGSSEEQLPFSSQYLREFLPIQCLGRGGFGVVFEAMKKIDDRHYAVKRISLPYREKSRVRVMREVKALAQLDHKNIVRYFNAWTENPPIGWLERNDPLWNVKSIGSPSPTVEYPSASSFDPLYSVSSHKKPDHSKISVPNTPSENQNVDDSFIVFASDSQSSTDVVETWRQNREKCEDLEPLIKSSIISMNSTDNSSSSGSGAGFFNRPTTLNIPSLSPVDDNSNISVSRFSSSKSNYDDEEREECKDNCDSEFSTVMYLYIQQELCQKRTLQDWLRSETDRSLHGVIKFFAQIVEAVEYVHSKKLIHRDLKPSNIFLAGDSEESAVVKIGDFGLATTALAELEAEQHGGNSPADENRSPMVRINLTGHVGTHLYMSPEQYQKKPYDYKVDIYSLGLIFFELIVPFTTDMERHDILSRVRKLNFPISFVESHPDEYQLIKEMVSHEPDKRPDATQIKAWVKEHLQKVLTTSYSSKRISDDKSVPTSFSEPSILKSSVKKAEGLKYEDYENNKHKNRFIKTQSCM